MLESIFHMSSDGMLIIEDGKFVDCNDSIVTMLGYRDKSEFLDKHPSELSPEFQPDGRSSFEKAEENTRVVLEKGHRTFEWLHLRANGEPFWVEVVLTDMQTEDRTTFLVVWREIGEKKRLEEEKAYQFMILESVLNSSSDIIFYKDYKNRDGVYLGCNPAFETFLGKSNKEIVGHNDIELFGEELGLFFREKDHDVLEQKSEISNEEWVTYPDGKKELLYTTKTLLKDSKNNTIGLLGFARNITSEYKHKSKIEELNKSLDQKVKDKTKELKEKIEILESTQEKLVEADKMASLGSLVAGISHEINTPVGLSLTGITHIQNTTKKIFKHLESGTLKQSELKQYFEDTSIMAESMRHSLVDAANLIHSFKQVAVDQHAEKLREFNLHNYVGDVLVSLKNSIKHENITVENKIDPKLLLNSYPGVFSQIITNLVINSKLHAFENSEKEGIITISGTMKDDMLLFTYTDNGKGMSNNIVKHIFDPFFTTKLGQGGSGLGMHIIYNLVTQKVNGTISCQSEQGQGTKFLLNIPMKGSKYE